MGSDLETQLNDFAPQTRASALAELVTLVDAGQLAVHSPVEAVNLHAHSFYSFNAYGHSPSSLAWLARKGGLKAMGVVDFDVLDAVDEFLAACETAAVRGSAAIETRVFIPEFATREISSPGEPGVAYHMGIGFTSSRAIGTAARILDDMRQRAGQRNRDLIDRVNAHLKPVIISYERDVLPLTPNGNATERHILVAYTKAAEHAAHSSGTDLVVFWAQRLGVATGEVAAVIADSSKLHNLIRVKLMKRGGVGYVQPSRTTFPSVDEFHQFIVGCQALPCATWLDGTSIGEQAIEELLNLLIAKGVVALNIIPDRNWNISNPDQKRIKLQNLYHVVRLAESLELPLNIGTEMNAYGQKFVDDFEAPELRPVRNAFLDGAYFVYGHTAMQRAVGMGYQSDWARALLPTRSERKAFYTRVGYLVPPDREAHVKLRRFSTTMNPVDMLTQLG